MQRLSPKPKPAADIHAMVVHGRPGKFSGGFDLNVMRGGDLAAMSNLVSDGGDLVRTFYAATVPVVAACTGHAIAAGALMLLGCDVRIGSDIQCKIGLNEVAIGMVLPDWAFTIAVDRLNQGHLQRAVANARLTDAAEAVAAGFLDEVAPESEVLEVAVARAEELRGAQWSGLRRNGAQVARRRNRRHGAADRRRPHRRLCPLTPSGEM